MAAVLSRALADLEKDRAAIEASPAVRDEAMTWVNGPDCEGYCLTLDVDYTVLRKKAAALYRRFLEKHDKAPEFSDTKKEGLKIHRTPGRAVRKTREEK
jgi:hypothetical protein